MAQTLPDQRISDLAVAMERSRGGMATVWAYSSSMSELTLRVGWSGSPENIHYVCNGCVRIHAPTVWADANLDFGRTESGEMMLSDRTAGFLVVCQQIRIQTNVELKFVAS